MKTLRAEHVGSGRDQAQWPRPDLPEYAFIGRSNVGKSSLINMLCGAGKLARVSNTPGRTRNVEHFRVFGGNGKAKGCDWYLADLPGYGFAKVSKGERSAWQSMLRTYLSERENLQCVFLLIDVRIPPQRNDQDMIQWLGEQGIPFVIVFTKSDKLSERKVVEHVSRYRIALKGTWNELPMMMITSATTGRGRDALIEFIDGVNRDSPTAVG
ncbi:MAG: YihA family ribosome biogenesis GTP-binding protein [Flavobacteriales bacterium]|nr:YihA family ribosome biogenesis GTP-binding protein [Flavobacteriales bacterium]